MADDPSDPDTGNQGAVGGFDQQTFDTQAAYDRRNLAKQVARLNPSYPKVQKTGFAYEEPGEGSTQYQVYDGGNWKGYDVGTGPVPNVGPGKIPVGYNVPDAPTLRVPDPVARTPTPTPPSMQSAGYSRDYDRYVGHLDPKYYGSSFATPHERFAAGAQTGATQTAITKQFLKKRATEYKSQVMPGQDQYDDLDSYAMDKYNSIPKMNLVEFQDMVLNDFGIHDPIRASSVTPLAPSVNAMIEEYDASLPAQYGTKRNPYDLSHARQAANLRSIGQKEFKPGTAPKFSDQSMMNAINDIKFNRPYSSETNNIINHMTSSVNAVKKSFSDGPGAGDMGGQPGFTSEGHIDAGVNSVEGMMAGIAAAIGGIAANFGMGAAIANMMGLVDPAVNQSLANTYFMSTLHHYGTEAEAAAQAAEMSAAASATISGLVDVTGHNPASAMSDQGIADAIAAAENEAAMEAMDTTTEVSGGPPGMTATVESGLTTGPEADFGAGVGSSTSGIGPSPGPDTSSSTGEGIEGIGKDGGEVRKYQDGSVDVGSIEPNRMDLINDPNAAPPSELADDVKVQAREGDVILPPESVAVMGLLNVNDMIKAGLGLALEVGAVVPPDVDPNAKVPVRLTNGEVIIPKVVADALGKERMQEIINKGLKLRAVREEEAKAQQQAQQAPPQAPQAPPQAPQAPPQAPQPMPQGLKEGSSGLKKQMDELVGDVKSMYKTAQEVYQDAKKNPDKWWEAGTSELKDAFGMSQVSDDLDTRAREAWESYHGSNPSLQKEAQFVLHQTGKDDPELRKEIRTVLPNYYEKRNGQIVGDKGMNPAVLEEILMRIAAHETPGGETRQMIINESGQRVPEGVARGRFQVEPSTARSMFEEAKGLIGPKVQSSLAKTFGVSYEDIPKLSDEQFNDILENNPRASTEFAVLNLLTKLERDTKLDLIR